MKTSGWPSESHLALALVRWNALDRVLAVVFWVAAGAVFGLLATWLGVPVREADLVGLVGFGIAGFGVLWLRRTVTLRTVGESGIRPILFSDRVAVVAFGTVAVLAYSRAHLPMPALALVLGMLALVYVLGKWVALRLGMGWAVRLAEAEGRRRQAIRRFLT